MPLREVQHTRDDGAVEKAVLKAGPVTITRLQKLQASGLDLGKLKLVTTRKENEFKQMLRKEGREALPGEFEEHMKNMEASELADAGVNIGERFEMQIDTVKLLLKEFFVNDQKIEPEANNGFSDDWLDEHMSNEIFQKIVAESNNIIVGGQIPLENGGLSDEPQSPPPEESVPQTPMS